MLQSDLVKMTSVPVCVSGFFIYIFSVGYHRVMPHCLGIITHLGHWLHIMFKFVYLHFTFLCVIGVYIWWWEARLFPICSHYFQWYLQYRWVSIQSDSACIQQQQAQTLTHSHTPQLHLFCLFTSFISIHAVPNMWTCRSDGSRAREGDGGEEGGRG